MHLEEAKDGPGGAGEGVSSHHTAGIIVHESTSAAQKSAPDLEFIASQNWYEGRPKDKIPERRAYHISFAHNNK
jgi:hypothetical protein